MEYLKNPIFLGIVAGVLAYLYMYWSSSNSRSVSINDDNENLDKNEDNTMMFLIPLIVAGAVWLGTSMYFSKTDTEIGSVGDKSISNKNNLLKSGKEMVGGEECHILLNNKVRLPESDVFIDIMPF